MNPAMARTDFENRFLDLLQGNFEELRNQVKSVSKKVDQNTAITEEVRRQAKMTNGRVTHLEAEVFFKKTKNRHFSWFEDKQLILIFAVALLVFLYILASVLGVKVPQISVP